VLGFLEAEISAGWFDEKYQPLQSGRGSIANDRRREMSSDFSARLKM
jgi:hypothetical protein